MTLPRQAPSQFAPPSRQRRYTSPSSPTFYLTIFLFFLILTLITPTPTNAQLPMSRRRAAFTQYNNQFFIQGGIPATAGGTGDLSALILNSSWPTASPAWTTLASGNWVWHHAMVSVRPEHSAGLGSTSTKGFLLTVGGYPPPLNAFFSVYNLQTGTWANLTTMSPYTGLEGHTAVADPATGLVYIMGGYYNLNPPNPSVGNLLTVFDPKTGTVVSRVEATNANNMTGASALWSSRRKTVLLFEGSRAVATGDVNAIEITAVREYDTTAGLWKTFETKGTFPSRRLDSCALESDDGSKIILFGGAVDANVFLNTIHILDVDSGQWTQGQSAPGPRSQMVCAYHAGFFIAFGGTSSKNLTEDLYSSQPIVYDVNKDQWVDRYSPAGAAPATVNDTNRPPNDIGSGTSPNENSHMGVIIGAGVGAMVVMIVCAVVLGYIVQKRRRDRKAAERDARALDILSDGEDHYSHRRRTIHKKSAASASNNNGSNRVMTAAEHYEAAQAAAELQAARVRDAATAVAIAADGSGESGEKRANSWNTDTFSQAASENESSILLMNVSKARRLSEGPTFAAAAAAGMGGAGVERVSMDPQTYYLHLLQQQQKLKTWHPELSLGDTSDNNKVEVQAAVPITAVGFLNTGLQQQQQQQPDRVRRSPHSMPGEAETLLGGNSSSTVFGGGGDGSPTTTAATSGAEKTISFVKRGPSSLPSVPTTSTQRGPHSVQYVQ